MRCMNCGLPLPPDRNLAQCPRCNAPLNEFQGVQQQQFEQAGWGNMGGAAQQNLWGQTPPPNQYNPYAPQNQSGLNTPGISGFNDGMGGTGSGLQQAPFSPRRLYAPPPKKKSNPRVLFMVAGICVLLSALILGFVAVNVFAGSGKGSPTTANTTAPKATATRGSTSQAAASATASSANASPTASASPSATGTAYPGQQYISGAQMVASDPSKTPGQQPTTSFTVGSNMYVTFTVNPPSQGGAVCAYWYLSGNQVTSFTQAVKSTTHSSYTYATYGSAGQAYVELYWASDKTCSDKVLAQHVDFTVTA